MAAVRLSMPRTRPGSAAGVRRGPLSLVADAVDAGAGTAEAVQRMTGLDAGTVDAALGHLERMGRVDRTLSQASCPTGGCRTCPLSEQGCGAPLT